MSQTPATSFSNASLVWDSADRPRSTCYGDIYFSGADAQGESTHVFLQGNGLAERWQHLAGADFIVGELGFGAGLNFLNTCRLWCEQAPAGSTLHYVGCELHPLTVPDMQRLHQQWPALQRYSRTLLSVYPDHSGGVHQCTLTFDQHHVVLTLLYGDAHPMLTALYRPEGWRADAWYLDGFSPKLNPALWETGLLQLIASLSKTTTTLTTYSVAGSLRQALTAAGFLFEKLPGYANKRHMLRATLPQTAGQRQATGQRYACIIGGGLAGCATAHALARSGWNVVLLEREPRLATQGSGNPQGILHCKPGKQDTAVNRFNIHAYLYAARQYQELAQSTSLPWHACGMLQVAVTPELAKRYSELADSGLYPPQLLRWIEATEASTLAGVPLQHAALYFPESGWISPPALCQHYTQQPGIRLHAGAEALRLEQTGNGWQVHYRQHGSMQLLETARVVICNSLDLHHFEQTRHYPVIGNRGQVDIYAGTRATELQTILCGQGYLLPRWQQQQSVGGSYFVGDGSAPACAERQQQHLQQLQDINPALSAALATLLPAQQRTGTRCMLPDRLPLLGQACRAEDSKPWPGLYLNVAHGSHGLTRTPLCAALLASEFNTTPPPLPPALAALLAPARYSKAGNSGS
jgi:tRNA 5-methylaminomethyl-2-thiouridine biosynthesis bifunctional protein